MSASMDGLRALFLGVSQSVFQQNGYTGLVLLFGVFLGSPWLGLAALLGLLTSTSAAWALGGGRARADGCGQSMDGPVHEWARDHQPAPEWNATRSQPDLLSGRPRCGLDLPARAARELDPGRPAGGSRFVDGIPDRAAHRCRRL